MFYSLDGVACTTKSTILSRLDRDYRYNVHLIDYKEISDQLGLRNDPTLDGIIYLMYRDNYKVPKNFCRHVFDREPTSALLYRFVQFNSDDATVRKYCTLVKKMGVNKHWTSIILLPRQGQEDIVVELMKKRNNGIDWLNVEYVKRQCRIFTIWADVMDYDVVYIDYNKNLHEQQTNIINKIHEMCCHENVYTKAIRLLCSLNKH
ncbi:Maph15 [Matsumuraeses phaseoli granulovirus]|uniref:Maph15 n=1 Tax=Matsumuraeses phaseoli granulovirus TaxID=2760664 RepID=A0AAE7ML95_9BBAC|nr:Maph15 [Matsumuraeses phaseoli granulovirus]QOD39978.1 Maph15 [Matsumuraeses phaseoli granulovirus]